VPPESISEVSVHFFDDLDTDQIVATADLIYNSEDQSWYLSSDITLESLSHGLNYYKIHALIEGKSWWSAKSTTFEIIHELGIVSFQISNASDDLNTYYVKTSYNITNPLWDEFMDDLTIKVNFYEEEAASPFEIKTAYYSSAEGVWITSITLTSAMDAIYLKINATITIGNDLFTLEIVSSPMDLEYFTSPDPSSPSESTANELNLASVGIVMLSMFSLVVVRRLTTRNKL